MVASGTDVAAITKLADLVEPHAFRRIMQARYQAVGRKENAYNVCLSSKLLQIARDWARADEDTLEELRAVVRLLPREKLGTMNAKNKKFLRQFDDPLVVKRLHDTPARLWRQVANDPKRTWLTLGKSQAAIAIAFLTYIPIRLQNLTALEFDRHLFLRPGEGATSTCELPADEVKNNMPMGFDIPSSVAKMLIEYRDEIAPSILGFRPTHVFINADGSPKTKAGVRAAIKTYLRKHVGIELDPHVFRHLAGKVILDRDPGAHELVKQFLGHKRISTTVTFYTGIDTRRAGLHYQGLLERAHAEQLKPKRRRRAEGLARSRTV